MLSGRTPSHMGSIWLFLLQVFSILGCVLGKDVGPDFDPEDRFAYESKYGRYPYRSYHSSNLTSPVIRKVIDTPECYDDRYLFLTARGDSVEQREPLILDNNGHLIWALDVGKQQPYNFLVQEYQGQPHITYWVGNDAVGGHGEGNYHILNSSYQEVATLAPLNGYKADLHELTITPQGTAIFSIYTQIRIMAFGRKVWVWDCLFQEVDIATNKQIFEWRASEHHSVEETYSSIGTGGRSRSQAWDWYHLNSVQKDALGNYFVSARYTRTLSYVDGRSGKLRWILGGRRNMFNDLSDGKGVDFAGQHFARIHDLAVFPVMMSEEIKAYDKADDKHDRVQKLVTMFDNGASDRTHVREYSRGLMLQIEYPSRWQYEEEPNMRATKIGRRDDEARESPFDGKLLAGHTVRFVQEYIHPEKISADSQGSFQVIPPKTPNGDPHVGLGYGQRPVFTEYTADGRVACDIQYVPKPSVVGAHMQSYRAFKEAWIGQPYYPPAVNLSAEHDSIYVSWNGATEVGSWQLQHATEPRSSYRWAHVTTAARKGFETEIKFKGHKLNRYLRVAAMGKDGSTLGISSVVDLGGEEYLGAEGESNSTTASASAAEVIAHFYTMTTPSFTLKLAMFALCAIAFTLTVYGCYRQYANWRQSRGLGYNRLRTASDDTITTPPTRQNRWFGYDQIYRRGDDTSIGIQDSP